jgi:hypothetical protein
MKGKRPVAKDMKLCFDSCQVAIRGCGSGCCAQQSGMHIIVEALLVAIYLSEEKRTYICTFDLACCLRPPCHLGPAQLNPQAKGPVDRESGMRRTESNKELYV